MDTVDIRCFIRCYETGSVNSAAKELFITSQGLGKIIDRLETELDTKLFVRSSRGINPTEAGEYFYSRCRELLNRLNDIEVEIKNFSDGQKWKIRVGYSCGVMQVINIGKMEKWQASLNSAQVHWQEGVNDQIKSGIQSGEFDAAFVVGRIMSDTLEQREVFSRKLSAVVYEGHKLFDREEISFEDLRNEQLITLNENFQSYYNILQRCGDFGFVPEIRIKTMESSLIYRFCSEHMGIGIDVNIHRMNALLFPLRCIEIKDSIPWKIYFVCDAKRINEPHIKDLQFLLCE